MTKREFLDTLRTQLQGELSGAQIEGHLRYYNEYISEAVAQGRTEEEVLEELGNPVFIAKTILDMSDSAQNADFYSQSYRQDNYERYEDGSFCGESDRHEDFFGGNMHTWNVNPKIAKWVFIAVVVTVLFVLFSLLGSLIMLVARFFIPILLVVLVISIFKKHGGR